MSRGPRRSRLSGDDVQRSTTLTTRRWRRPEVHDTRSSLAIGIELRPSSLIEPWATSSPMKHDGDSSPLISENYPDDDGDLALLALRTPGPRFFFFFFNFFFIVCVLGDLVCVSLFLWNFFFFFFLYLCLCLVAQKMWKRNGNLDFSWSFKKPT